MKRTRFVHQLLGLGAMTLVGCKWENKKEGDVNPEHREGQMTIGNKSSKLQDELHEAWVKSEERTMVTVTQMPPELFTFKYTEEAMSFAEQWRHCVIYTCGQLSARAKITNPYEGVKLPVQMQKEEVIRELKKMYAFVRQSIREMSSEKLVSQCEFAGDQIPIWRLFYAMENHIIHHRGQCMVYLRLKGITPKGYYGW